MNEVINGLIQFINGCGFPIFVAVWMLWKGSRDSEKMTEAMNTLAKTNSEVLKELKDAMKGGAA